jgi:hypothetical protein
MMLEGRHQADDRHEPALETVRCVLTDVERRQECQRNRNDDRYPGDLYGADESAGHADLTGIWTAGCAPGPLIAALICLPLPG